MSKLELAIGIATDAHRGQVDKGGHPYILHPLRVMLALDGHQDQIVGVLHDVVEDTAVVLAQIRYEFGDRIAAAVDALTKRKGESYDDYLERVKADDIARRVKLADLKDNSELNRLGRAPDDYDRKRLEKYMRARAILQE